MWLKLLLGSTAYNSQKYTSKNFWTTTAVLATRSKGETSLFWNNWNSPTHSKRGKLLTSYKKKRLSIKVLKNSTKLCLFNNFLFHVCQVNDVDRHKDKSSHGFLSSLRRGHHWYWYPYKSSGGWEFKSIAFLSCTVWPKINWVWFFLLLKNPVLLCYCLNFFGTVCVSLLLSSQLLLFRSE